MRTVILLIAATLAQLLECKEEYFCFESTGKNKEIITQLPNKFGVLIEFVDQVKNFSADIEERFDGAKNVSSLKCDHGDVHSWIFNRTSNKFTLVKSKSECETTCETKDWSSATSQPTSTDDAPLFFPNNLIKLPKPVSSLFDLYDLFNSSMNVSKDMVNHEQHDHGIDIEHYVGCNKTSDDKYWIEFLVCVSSEKFRLPDKTVKNIPTRIELKIYTADQKNVQLAFSAVYEMSQYRSQLDRDDEEYFLPPPGVKCDGWPTTKPFPDLAPKKFSVDIEYVDYAKSSVDNSKLYYDEERKIVGFDYSHNNTDEPMTAGLTLAAGQYKIVHDFRSGLQYVLNSNSKSCVSVSGIPTDAGDVKTVDERKLGMRNVQEILLSRDAKDYVYVGQRFVDDVPMEVWSGSFTKNYSDPEKKIHSDNFVFDVYFNVAPWTLDTQSGSTPTTLPMFLKVYHRNNYNDYTTTAQHFHDYNIFDAKTNLLWTQLDVFTCLNLSLNDSFLMIKLNGSFDDLKIAGLDFVENRLREVISNAANVSVLRVTNFYYQPDAKSAFVFFVVADKSKQSPSATIWLEPEVDAATARKKLNESLSKKELAFDVQLPEGKTLYFAVQQGSLNATAPWFLPVNKAKLTVILQPGFSRGSMAALGICMLIIGVVAGLAAAFYMWKRNRGVAYHIYE